MTAAVATLSHHWLHSRDALSADSRAVHDAVRSHSSDRRPRPVRMVPSAWPPHQQCRRLRRPNAQSSRKRSRRRLKHHLARVRRRLLHRSVARWPRQLLPARLLPWPARPQTPQQEQEQQQQEQQQQQQQRREARRSPLAPKPLPPPARCHPRRRVQRPRSDRRQRPRSGRCVVTDATASMRALCALTSKKRATRTPTRSPVGC